MSINSSVSNMQRPAVPSKETQNHEEKSYRGAKIAGSTAAGSLAGAGIIRATVPGEQAVKATAEQLNNNLIGGAKNVLNSDYAAAFRRTVNTVKEGMPASIIEKDGKNIFELVKGKFQTMGPDTLKKVNELLNNAIGQDLLDKAEKGNVELKPVYESTNSIIGSRVIKSFTTEGGTPIKAAADKIKAGAGKYAVGAIIGAASLFGIAAFATRKKADADKLQ